MNAKIDHSSIRLHVLGQTVQTQLPSSAFMVWNIEGLAYHSVLIDCVRVFCSTLHEICVQIYFYFLLFYRSRMLSVISNWLDSKSELKAERRNCDAELLESDVIANLESKIEWFMKKNKRGLYVNIKAKPFHLYMV